MEIVAHWNDSYPLFQIILSFLSLVFYFVISAIVSGVVLRRARKHNFEQPRASYIKRAVKVGIGIPLIVVLGIIWEISLKGLSMYIASFATIAGVALFANWSILSNITASVILFFFFPFKIGSRVRIADGDNSIEGVVLGISLFSISIRTDEGDEVYCPNNLAIQKSVFLIIPKESA